jgi:hypothetical protein
MHASVSKALLLPFKNLQLCKQDLILASSEAYRDRHGTSLREYHEGGRLSDPTTLSKATGRIDNKVVNLREESLNVLLFSCQSD